MSAMLRVSFFLFFCVLRFAGFSSPPKAFADGPARVIVLKGEAKTNLGKKMSQNDSIPMGTVVTTEARSFVKLLFADNTQMSIGPNTSIKVELVAPGQANLIQLIGGQIRSKVYKDVLKSGDKEPENKLLIKTKSAAMGIRGTDFLASYNEINDVSSLVVFEGVVAMAKVSGNDTIEIALRDPNRTQAVGAGTVSLANPSSNFSTPPVKISPSQLESLKANETLEFSKSSKDTAAPPPSHPSPIAPGLDPSKASLSYNPATPTDSPTPPNNATTTIGPKPGGNLDITTGTYVQPPPGSVYDANARVFIAPSSFGGTDQATGAYRPPEGLIVDPIKGFVAIENANQSLSPEKVAQLKTYAEILNVSMSAQFTGASSTFDKTFAPISGGKGNFLPEIKPQNPNDPNKNQAYSLMPPKEPVNDPFCPTCVSDNVTTFPPQTTLKFRFK